nr:MULTISPECIES: CPBP family intramembrane glutamic endopeptidase [Listeria]
MLFLLSFCIFNVDLRKKFSIFKGILPAIFSAIILYIIFYIGAFIFKFLPFGLNSAVHSAFNKYATDNWLVWILLVIAIVPGEEIFWRGFVLKRLLDSYANWFALLVSSILSALFVVASGNIAMVIAIFVASLFWGALYIWRPSLLMLYMSHLLFAFLLLSALPIY